MIRLEQKHIYLGHITTDRCVSEKALREVLQDHFDDYDCECTWFGEKRNTWCHICMLKERFGVLGFK